MPERTEYKIAMAYFKMLSQQTALELNISCTEVFLGSTHVLSVPPKPTYKQHYIILEYAFVFPTQLP
jgi:hypothetical protein